MICQWCSYRNREGSLYCGDCGRTLQADLACGVCSTPNPSDNPFCDACGAVLAGAQPTELPRAAVAVASGGQGIRAATSSLLRPIRERSWVPKPGAKWDTPAVVWPSSRPEFQSWVIRNKLELAFVALITIVAAFLRLYKIVDIPAGLHGDEAWTGLDALRIMAEGWIGPYVGSAIGQPTGPLYFTALIFKLSEPTLFTVRLSMAILGILTVPAAYLLLRIGFGRWVAIFAVLALTFAYWHLHYSRMAFMVISMPLITTLAATSLLVALRSARVWPWAIAGGLLGLGVYSYNGYLAFLPAIGVFLAIFILLNRDRWRPLVPRFGVYVAVALLVALPLVRLAVFEPEFYFQHARTTSVLRDPGYAETNTFGEKFSFMAGRLQDAATILWTHPEVDYVDGMGGRGAMDPIMALLAYIGLIIAFARWRSPPHLLLALTVVFGLSVVLLGSQNLGELRRTLLVVPFVYGLAGVAAIEAVRLVRRRYDVAGLMVSVAVVAVLMVGVVTWNTYQYFGVVVKQSHVGWVLAADLVAALDAADDFDDLGQVYFYAGRWSYNYETVRFLYPDTPGLDRSREHGEYSLERIDSGPVTYLMLPPYADDIDTLKETLPGGEVVEEFSDGGSRVFSVYHLP
jgi:4-amino-4-deoxy-L-arabinose transferase-like glycosyltransferase